MALHSEQGDSMARRGDGAVDGWNKAGRRSGDTRPRSESKLLGASQGKGAVLAAVLLLILAVVTATSASANESPGSAEYAYPQITSQDIVEASTTDGVQGLESQLTDPGAAKQLPHRDLGREEVVELLNSVFELQLQSPAGIYDDLQVERFLSDNAAVIAAGDRPEESGIVVGDSSEPRYGGPTLLQSTVPLRVESPTGEEEVVDLSLEHSQGELQPANPLVEIGIPQELGDGIQLGTEDPIQIQLPSAPQGLSPSMVNGSVAVYPNVDTDTDLVVAPAPEGVETLTQMRSPQAPTSQTFHIDMPVGASLRKTESGGAEVVDSDGETVLHVAPPSAMDANGSEVAVVMTVSGDALSLHVLTSKSTAYPILVDPMYQTYQWYELTTTQGTSDFVVESNEPSLLTGTMWSAWMPNPGLYLNSPGLYVQAHANTAVGGGASAAWSYYVPRLKSDEAQYGDPPHSFISGMHLHDLGFFTEKKVNGVAYSDGGSNPHLWSGIWDGYNKTWPTSFFHDGPEGQITNFNATFDFPSTDENAKIAEPVALSSYAWRWMGENWRESYVGYVSIEVADTNKPTWGESEGPGWVNAVASRPIEVNAEDAGLGIKNVILGGTGVSQAVTRSPGCTGLASSPCPRKYRLLFTGYEPAKMPQGIQYVYVNAEDVIGNRTQEATPVQVKIDHTPPALTVSGSATEQAALGVGLASYSVKVKVSDGTTASPQSGAVKTVVKIDGKVVDEYAPGCTVKNCEISREWPLESNKYSAGQHTLEVIATDGVGLSATKTLSLQLRPDHLAPTVALSGSMTEQASLGASRPRYALKINAADPAESDGLVGFVSSFGSAGSSNGQFNHPADVAIDSKGNLWVADTNNNQIEKFNQAGVFVAKYGSMGSGNGQLSYPASLAIDSKNNLWVADTNNNRIVQFNEAGTFVKAVGSSGLGNGQFSGPEGIAIDSKGNIWVADTYSGRVQKFNENGEFLKVAGSYGSGAGQLGEPTGIDVSPTGNVWIADWQYNRLSEFSETGDFIRQVGSEGVGSGQFNRPDALDVDFMGQVWVGDENNERIEKFGPNGEYLAQFGSSGSGPGQFSFSYPMGVESDTKGNHWIADTDNNRVQKWTNSEGTASGVAAVTVKVDGIVVDSTSPGCLTGSCSLSREWMLGSNSYSAGQHTVEVTAIDVAGHATAKTLSISIVRDTVPPVITADSVFFTAPEGWVEQQPYSYLASAADLSGYGMSSITLKVDGSTVKSVSKTCPDGGCEEVLSSGIDTTNYSGGAHSAELIATDGAGNIARRAWTMNVDPAGAVSAEEATATLEALEETTESSPVAPSDKLLEPEQMEGGDNPSLVREGEDIESKGVPDETTLTTDPAEGIIINGPDGKLDLEPVGVPSSPPTKITEEVAAVSPSLQQGVDTVVRPQYNGATTFQQIRGATSPETYSWTVKLSPEKILLSLDEQHAEVRYEDGPRAYLITAEQAHDATGKAVATSLTVSGNVLTLTVYHHAGGVVYPVLAGQAYETSYQPVVITGPLTIEDEELESEGESNWQVPPPPLSPSQGERLIKSRMRAGAGTVPPPAPEGGGASASIRRVFTVKENAVCQIDRCAIYRVYLRNPSYIRGYDWVIWEPNTEVHCGWSQDWQYSLTPIVEETGCDFANPSKAYKGEDKHLTIFGRWEITAPVVVPPNFSELKTNYLALQIWVWPNGYQEPIVKHYDPATDPS